MESKATAVLRVRWRHELGLRGASARFLLRGGADVNARAIYGRADMRGKPRRRGASRLTAGVRFGHETEEEDATDAWASFVSERNGRARSSVTAKEKATAAACELGLGLLGPRRREGVGQPLGLATCWAKSRESERGEVLSFSF